MRTSHTWLRVSGNGFWLAACIALWLNTRFCSAGCLTTEAHLNCFSKDLVHLGYCLSSESAYDTKCYDAFPKEKDLPVPKEWISAKHVGAWFRITFYKPLSLTKVIVQQRSAEFPQISELSLTFDQGPELQMSLTCNVDGTTPVFDRMSFASRVATKLTFTVVSMHTSSAELPGFRSLRVYDENCDRDYQELNMEHRSQSTWATTLQSWTPFTGALKTFLSFPNWLTFHLAVEPSVKSDSYKITINAVKKNIIVHHVKDTNKVFVTNATFSYSSTRNQLLSFYMNGTHWIIGDRTGQPAIFVDKTSLDIKYWGISFYSSTPVKLTYWKHIGQCYKMADYYWLADKLLGGTTLAELRRGKDGRIRDINEAQVLPFGPFIDGHTSSALYLSGAYSGGVHLAKFHHGCFSDVTKCSEGYSVAVWVSLLDASQANAWKQILWLSNFGLSFNSKLEDGKILIRTATTDYEAEIFLGRAYWNHVFILWDPVNGLTALVNNKQEYQGTRRARNGPPRPGYTSLQIGQKTGAPTRTARMAVRDIAVWHRRLSLVEAREYYHCNNLEIPREFLANQRAPLRETGTLPFPGQNIASPKHGCTCTGVSCAKAIDGNEYSDFTTPGKQTISTVLTFDQAYMMNKILFRVVTGKSLNVTFSDGTVEQFKLVNNLYGFQEVYFPARSSQTIAISVKNDINVVGIAEIQVYYDSRDRLPSSTINWARGCRVSTLGSTPLVPDITDGSTYLRETTLTGFGGSGTPSSKRIHIDLPRTVKVNLLRLWLVDDADSYDHVKTFKLQFSDQSELQLQSTLPGVNYVKTYSRDFVFEEIETSGINIDFVNTHDTRHGQIGIREVELFYDTSKDLPASKTIINNLQVRTWEKNLANAKLGPFDFLLNVDLKMTQKPMSIVGRQNSDGHLKSALKTISDGTLYARVRADSLTSKTVIADDTWHNVRLYYNSKESRLSLFIDQRLEATLTSYVPEELDGWFWTEGETLNSEFSGKLKNFIIHQAVRGFGMETKKIPDTALFATAALNSSTGADQARLNGQGAWLTALDPSTENQYVQVDLGSAGYIVYVAFQGSVASWVTWARISYSMDGVDWTFPLDIEKKAQIFRASEDAHSVAMVMLYSPVVARYIRIHPHLVNGGVALRTEIYDLDYGLPFNSMLEKHVPSYRGCVKRSELFKLPIFLPSSFKSSASTSEDCRRACALEGYELAGLFQGVTCCCTETTFDFKKLSDEHCSFPCPGNTAFRCGGETTVSLYQAPVMLCSQCTVGIYSSPFLAAFAAVELFTNSSGGAVSFIDVSYNGAHVGNFTSGAFEHKFLNHGVIYVVAEAKDSLGRQVAVASRRVHVQQPLVYMSISCPKYVFIGDTYDCSMYIQRGTAMDLTCTIDGDPLPIEVDDSTLIATGDVTVGYPAVNDTSSAPTILPAQVVLVRGILAAFQFVTTAPGSVTLMIFRAKCTSGKVYCQTTLRCVNGIRECPSTNYPTTSSTFPSTGRLCDPFDPYCPSRKSPVTLLTLTYQSVFVEKLTVNRAGLHTHFLTDRTFTLEAGDYVGFASTDILQYKSSGIMFRADKLSSWDYAPRERIEGRTAMVAALYWKTISVHFTLNKTGELKCSLTNDVSKEPLVDSTLIAGYERIEDVKLNFANLSATNETVSFMIPPHPGGQVSYTFRFAWNEQIAVEGRNSHDTLTFNYTFTTAGHHKVDLTVNHALSSVLVGDWIRVMDPIQELYRPCPVYVRVNELTNISWSAKSGADVTLNVSFGDGAWTKVGPLNLRAGVEYGVPYLYKKVGTYTASIIAINAVSAASLTGPLVVIEPVCNVSVTMATRVAFEGEPVELSASVKRGSDVMYLAIFQCQEKEVFIDEQGSSDGKFLVSFPKACEYQFTVLAYNNVSTELHNTTLLVEELTIVNLRATVGLSVAGKPTDFKPEVDSGAVIDCTWNFGDSDVKTLPFGPPVAHVYPTGGKYLLQLNCSNPRSSANTTLEVKVLAVITQLDITTLHGAGTTGENIFPLEEPVTLRFATNCIFVNFTLNFGNSLPPVVTEKTSLEHSFSSPGSYDVHVNVSNGISYKISSVSITVLESVKDVAVQTNGPVKLGEEMVFEVTAGQIGSSACYYFNLGDGTELIYKVDSLTSCNADYKHVTDVRTMTSAGMRFTHAYANVTVYHVTCVASNLVSSSVVTTQAVIVEIPCTTPVVSVEGLAQSVEDPREFLRSEEFEVTSKNTIDCEATSETKFEWKVFKVAPQGSSKDESAEVSLPGIKTDDWKIVFKPRSLGYGLYHITFTLTMVGLQGVSSSTFGYVRITPSPIVAEVRGGSSRVVGFNKMILLDGSVSRDPDVEEGDYEGMSFYWHCKRSDENYTFPSEPGPVKAPLRINITNSTEFVDHGGCYGEGAGRLNYSDSTRAINVDTGLMRENVSYALQLLVKKDSRESLFNLFMEVIPGDPPTVVLTCLRNCLTKFNPTVKVSLEVKCQDCRNSDTMNYRWQVYLYSEGSWNLLDNVDDVTLTRPSSPNLVIKEESLLGNRTYKIRVLSWRPGGIPGSAELVRTVNVPPFGGWCFASPKTGFALDTLYGVACGDWKDDNLPLKYTFSYIPGRGTLESMIYVGENSFSPNVSFPTGQEANNTLYLVVLITDSLDASTLVELSVQVKPANTDALKSKVEDMTSANGSLTTMLSSGDTQNALQMISAVGNMLNFELEKHEKSESAEFPKNRTDTPQEETKSEEQQQEENTKVRTSLVKVISTAPVKTLEDAHRTSAVLGTVTKETGEVSVEAQDTATSTLETVGNVLESAADKPGTHPRTVAKTAEAVLSGLGNVIQAAFFVEEPAIQEPKMEVKGEGNSEGQMSETVATEVPPVNTAEEDPEKVSQEKKRKQELANKLMTVIKKVAKAVTTNKAPGERPTRIDTPHLSLEVYRESPDELSRKVLTAGSGSFALPQMGAILNGSGTVDVSTVATPTNPFEDEAKRIHSVVMTTEIRNASGGIPVSGLDEAIDIRLPRDPKPVPSRRLYQATAGKMIFHKFDVTHNDSSINIDLHLVGNCSERAKFSLFLQKDRKPSVLYHMFNTTIPDVEVKWKNNASKSQHTFFLSNVDLKRDAAGRFYLGVIYNRSGADCPEFMNYTLDFFTSGCLYWHEERSIWQGDGCTVGYLTNLNETQCLCNHLTSFGGDFMVPPNSIDWDAVSADFLNLEQNPVVFAVVMSFIALYLILLVWVRRVDKKDLEEFVTIPLPDNDPRDSYNYEVVVYTGHPKYCGTTANVFIIISGNLHETEPRALLDLTNTALKPGGVDTFILSVPSTLGKLDHVRIWHDNSGESPSWYLSRVLVRDVQTDRKTWFLCDQWFAVEEDDGLIDRALPAATKDDLISFNFLFSIEARRKMFDEHLWFSVLSRRPRSQFTRAQRLSCCLALLLSTMLANAMFYQVDDSSKSGNHVRAGPLVFSLKQLWIGFISCLVIMPVNLFIVYIFRNVRDKDSEVSCAEGADSDRAQKYAVREEESEILADPTESLVSCSKTSLPRRFIYVGYILLFLTISVSATFTIFYGFTFGKEKSEKWISSTLLSFFQDLMLFQPLKVFIAATFIALIIKDPNKVDQGDKSDNKPELLELEGQTAGDEEQFMLGEESSPRPITPRSVLKPLAETELVAARELRTKQKIMRRIISEVCWYVAYLVLISVVAYGNRNPKAYLVTKTMNDMFVENKYAARLRLNDISSIPQYWSWLYNSILPAVSPPYWYGPYGLDDIETISKTMASKSRAKAKSKSSKTKASGSGADDMDMFYHDYPKGFTADRAVSYIVGQVRVRQLRNEMRDCIVHPTVRHLQHHCSQDYSWSNEDENCYNISWSPYNGSQHNCQRMKGVNTAWSYRTAWELKGTPFWGNFHNYWGGGYVWSLDSSLSTVQKESKILQERSWIDHQTRAIFFEFTIYNAFTNFFCSVTLLLEQQNTGGIYPYGQLHSLRLYHYVGTEAFITLVCEIIFVGVLCYIFTRELKEARSRGIRAYFRDPWNYFDILGLVFSFTAIGLYFARMAATSLALDQIHESKSGFVSFHYISAIDQSFTILLALAVFVYFLKVLRLLRFNRKISLLSTTLIACTHTLVGFMLTYLLLFAAYAQLMYLVYGRDLPEYSSYHRCLSSLMEMTLGSSDFDGMNATNRILTGFIFFSYTLLNMCVYMNLFISILSETFSEVRGDVLLQPNDHEIVDFMIKSVKKAVFHAVEPMTAPIYKEAKDDLDIGVDKITNTSECIQGALQGLCKEDIRQTLWFGDKSKLQEKRVLFSILLESGETWTENDIGEAVPLFDDILKKFTLEHLLEMQLRQRRRIAHELAMSRASSGRRTRFTVSGSERYSSDDEERDGDWYGGGGVDSRREGSDCWSQAGDMGGSDEDDSRRGDESDGGYSGNYSWNGEDGDGDGDGGEGDGGNGNGNGSLASVRRDCDNDDGHNEKDGYGDDGGDDGDCYDGRNYHSDDEYSQKDRHGDDGHNDSDRDDDDHRRDSDSDAARNDDDDDVDCDNADNGDCDNADNDDVNDDNASFHGQHNGDSGSDYNDHDDGRSDDDGAHSDTDYEADPSLNDQTESTMNTHDSNAHGSNDDHHTGHSENRRPSSQLSPRRDACVIHMEQNNDE